MHLLWDLDWPDLMRLCMWVLPVWDSYNDQYPHSWDCDTSDEFLLSMWVLQLRNWFILMSTFGSTVADPNESFVCGDPLIPKILIDGSTIISILPAVASITTACLPGREREKAAWLRIHLSITKKKLTMWVACTCARYNGAFTCIGNTKYFVPRSAVCQNAIWTLLPLSIYYHRCLSLIAM